MIIAKQERNHYESRVFNTGSVSSSKKEGILHEQLNKDGLTGGGAA